jgi:transcriptional regulator with PAS, ATPase and Fis domain
MEVSFEELSSQKEELNSIVSTIQEGILVLDSKGKILLSNESFRKSFQVFLVDGKYYWEVIRGPYLGELIEKVTNKKESESSELVLHDKTFLCNAIFLNSRTCTSSGFPILLEVDTASVSEHEVIKLKDEAILNMNTGYIITDDGYTDFDKIRAYAQNGILLVTPAIRVKKAIGETYRQFTRECISWLCVIARQ